MTPPTPPATPQPLPSLRTYPAGLTEREVAVLRLLALGHTNQEIAGALYISVRTAETHRAHIMQKLDLASRADLVRYAIENGMLDTSGDS